MRITVSILLIVLFIFYINQTKSIDNENDKFYLSMFNVISLLFTIIFLYFSLLFGFKLGIFNSIIIWSLFVVATPIPEAGLLVSVPLKRILGINLDITQWFVSIVALCFLFYSYYHFKTSLSKTKHGNILLRIIHFGFFGIFISSILGSVTLAYLINKYVDGILYKKDLNDSTNVFIFLLFCLSVIYYFYILAKLPKL